MVVFHGYYFQECQYFQYHLARRGNPSEIKCVCKTEQNRTKGVFRAQSNFKEEAFCENK